MTDGATRPHSAAARRLRGVRYNLRGPLQRRAHELEADGRRVLMLNLGNPASFGFAAPDRIIDATIRALPTSHGYSRSTGLIPVRESVRRHYLGRGVDIEVDDIYLGNGVAELIAITLQAILDPGDEVLVPAPDFPLWSAHTVLNGGVPVPYRCDETRSWSPDLDDIRSKLTPATKAIVVINPNNPTGAVYDRETLDGIARLARHRGLVILADEIYDQIVYPGARHISIATVAPDVVTFTFAGLSKNYRVGGFRAGWLAMTGDRRDTDVYREGLDLLSEMRVCPNVPGQYAITAALDGDRTIADLVAPGGRLFEQQRLALRLLHDIPGVSCVPPAGGLFVFPRLDPDRYRIGDDRVFAMRLLEERDLLVVPGSDLNQPDNQHLRLVTLQPEDELREAIQRLADYLADYRTGKESKK